ncbi:MAG: AMP-binding protein [Pirellulales bacterium]
MFTDIKPTSTMFETADGPHPTRTAELLERSDGPLTLATEAGETRRFAWSTPSSLFDRSGRPASALTKHLLAQLADACRNDRLHDPVSRFSLLDAKLSNKQLSQALAQCSHTTCQLSSPPLRCKPRSDRWLRPSSSTIVRRRTASCCGEPMRPPPGCEAAAFDQAIARAFLRRSFDRRSRRNSRYSATSAIYVPLDPKYPPGRRRRIFSDSVPALLVVGRQLLQSEEFDAASTIMIEEPFVDAAPTVASNRPQFAATDPAVILYTSGSTGTPKGVVLTHGNLAAQNAAVRRAMDYSADDRTTTLSSPCFDAALEEVFAPLCCVRTLVLPQADVLESLERLLDLATTERLTVLDMPTSLCAQLTNYLADVGRRFPTTVRAVMTGGERATAATFQRFLRAGGDGIRWFNAYGPTEANDLRHALRARSAQGGRIAAGHRTADRPAY